EAYPKQPDNWASSKVIFLPNYYPVTVGNHIPKPSSDFIDIACFGAVRPLKNTMLQAVAALRFADRIGKKLRFHINSSRVECQGEPVLKSLRTLFSHLSTDQ